MTVPAETRKEWIRSRRQRKKVARRARFRRQMVRYMVLCLLLVLGWSGFTKLPWTLKHGQEDILVHGNQVVSVEQIRGAIADVGKTPLYRVNPRLLEKQIVALKAVKHAFVRRYALPKPRIVVEVLEEFPWASYSQGPEQPVECVIAQSGRMIPIKDFPSITQPQLIFYGKPGMKMDHSNVAQWAKWVAYISEQTGQPVEYVDLRNSNDVQIQNGDLHLKLGIADTSLTRRLGRLTSVLAAIQPMKSRLEYIDLSLDNNIPLKVSKKEKEAKDIKERTSATAATTHPI
ncbi:MAG: FtsQ-type POTRA domain-containing protein [Candidatus Obscuribacterales bacterium]|nr:FtsQ-type POTRA domain-containing protein [Cyanobacteria bacterium SZAS LIN-5]RTL38767.1 MAG: FtsQ-type POTRA domain-containing protein [Candidatus Melainabacteria bacterium]